MTNFIKPASVLVAALLSLAGVFVSAQPVVGGTLNESVVMVKKGSGLFSVELETTLFKPEGDGPFPVVIVNHGKATGNPRFQARWRPLGAVRFFLARGYMVVAPMRQGFSKSSGTYLQVGCNVRSNGLEQARDVAAVVDYLKTLAWADTSRIVVLGQSHGGLTTMAFGTLNHPGVKGLINFAGGLKSEGCTAWQS